MTIEDVTLTGTRNFVAGIATGVFRIATITIGGFAAAIGSILVLDTIRPQRL
jgi:hypothetical protein